MKDNTNYKLLKKASSWMLAFLLICTYCGFAYFGAATASMSDNYLPGIETVKMVLSPFLLVVVLMGALFYSGNVVLGRIIRNGMAWSIIVCIVMLQQVLDYDGATATVSYTYLGERTLPATVWNSLLNPNFSNRSTAVLLADVLLASVCFLVSGFFYAGDAPSP